MAHKNKKVALITGLILLFGSWGVWRHFGSATHIALVNFPGFQSTGIVFSNSSKHVKYSTLKQDEIQKFMDYDYVLVFGMGLKWNAEQHAEISKMAEKGFPLQVIYPTVAENAICGLDSVQSRRVLEYIDSNGKRNYQSFAYYVRKYIDKKKWFAPEPEEWIESPSDVFYHIDEEVAYKDKRAFDQYLKEHGFYHEGAPKIAIIGGLTDPFGGAKSHLDSLIHSLEQSGLNVYPISSMMQRIEFLQSVEPDLIIYMPHGRMAMGQGDRAVEYLKRLNVPLLAPITLLTSEKEWRADPMGMSGGFMSQTLVMPELDGALYPYALFSQEKTEEGFEITRAMPQRLKAFTQLVHRFLKLKRAKNADKRVAIFFFKGPGQEAMAAQGLETVPSLYNTLLHLRAEGYNVDGLPDSIEDFRREVMAQGDVFESYEKHDMTRFVDHVAPALVPGDTLKKWIDKALDPELSLQLREDYGTAPGEYFVKSRNDTDYLIVARLKYGNVVLLPQPMAGIGTDKFQVIHGAKMPPPYPYVGAYLWARNDFCADAIVHFGTHGSLEFTPSKQVALGDTDWSDQLIGAVPHFYYYTIGNIGESMMAKRRSYAATISYLTPAFNESGARGIYADLQSAIMHYYDATDDTTKAKYADEVKKHTIAMGIHRELRLDSLPATTYTSDDINRIDNFAEEIAAEKVNASLYTTGIPYTAERINSTVMAMSADPIAYAMARYDQVNKKESVDYTNNKRIFRQKYIAPATALVRSILTGRAADEPMVRQYLGISAEDMIEAHTYSETKASSRMGGMPSGMRMSSKNSPASSAPHGRSMGGSMPHGMPRMGDEEEGQQLPEQRHSQEWSDAVIEVETAILNVSGYRSALLSSPGMELTSMVDALSGGYVSPSSGGDAVSNPNAVPTGRNLYSINAESTPSARAWDQGVKLAKQTIEEYKLRHGGAYPTKVSYTFWSSEFIESQGTSIAQVLYMIGVEPVRDSFGRVSDLRLIPSGSLGRPRIDVVVQTSGQFRDLAASRLALITRAIEMAAQAPKEEYDNYVADGTLHTEKLLVEAGVAPKRARALSTKRIFGGINGMYGTGIQEMITAGDKWDSEVEIAEVYLNNMGASYATIEEWGEFSQPLFRAALANTDVVVQPRQSNTWGALSLDHVYEFMGGLTLTVRNVTGKDPDAYFSDYRNRNNFRMQELKEAIGVESRSTILNPAFVKEMISGGASSLSRIVEVTTNTYGWNVAKPEVIDDELWNEIYRIYVEDKLNLGIPEVFEKINPQAMQEVTAVMIETIRKGMWKATLEQTSKLASVHADLTVKFGTVSGGMASTNPKLQRYIKDQLPTAEEKEQFQSKQDELTGAQQSLEKGIVMSKEEKTIGRATNSKDRMNGFLVAAISVVVFAAAIILVRHKRKQI